VEWKGSMTGSLELLCWRPGGLCRGGSPVSVPTIHDILVTVSEPLLGTCSLGRRWGVAEGESLRWVSPPPGRERHWDKPGPWIHWLPCLPAPWQPALSIVTAWWPWP
jgi:hypothetical protein